MTYKHGGQKVQLAQKIQMENKRIVHRYASVPIFDRFDYEKKLEEGIRRNYLENNYDYYLFRHKNKGELSVGDMEMSEVAHGE